MEHSSPAIILHVNENLRKIIKASKLVLHNEVFIYAKVKSIPQIDNHFFISKDSDEITVITKKENISKLDLLEKSSDERSLIEIQFSDSTEDSVGFLAAVSSALAEQGISISVISTFSKDYLIINKEDEKKTIQSLKQLGFE